MSFWNYARSLPDKVKDSLAKTWLTPAYGIKEHLVTVAVKLGQSLRRQTAGFTARGSVGQTRVLRRAAIVSVLVGAATAHGQCPPIGFQGLGDLPGGATESLANGLSKDGTTVVGQSTSAGGPEAFRWTAATNMVGLGDAPGGAFGSFAWDVSADGSIVSGWTLSGNGNCLDLLEAFRWTEVDGLTLLGDLPGGCFYSAGTAMSDDGSVIVGVSADLSNYRASYWTAGTGWVGVGPAANSSSFVSVSADGTVMGGGTADGNLIRWTSATGVVYLGDLPGGAASASGYGMSDDGNIIVGYGNSATGREAIRWTQATGIVGLGDLSGGSFESYAPGINSDGSIIVGYGNSALGQEAVMWIDGGPIQRVVDVLADNGVAIPCGWTLTFASAVTVNCGAVTLVGHAINADGDPEAWIASYRPSAPLVGFFGLGDLPGNIYSSGGAAVSADGTTVVGTSFSVNCTSTYTGEPFRWRADTGIVGLGDLPGADFMGFAYGVSADGSVVTGWSSSGNACCFGNTEAYRWTEASGMVGLGDLAGGLFKSEGDYISNDGNTIVGNAMDSGGNRAAFWTPGGGWMPVGPANIQFLAMSRNGPWACGYDASGAFRWSQGTGYESIGDLPGGATVAFGQRVSDSGIVVGYGTSASGTEAFVWNPTDGMVGLGDLPDGSFGSYANGISADGTIIVGNGTSAIGDEAVLWDESLAMHLVVDVLADNGVAIPCGWTLTRANDVTINCGVATIVGNALNPGGDTEGWMASYVHSEAPDTDGDLVTDCTDNCPDDPNPLQEDDDNDLLGDVCDNCPEDANFTQVNSDSDALGDACDNCPTLDNEDQTDSDLDLRGNVCDNCPTVANPQQQDADSDNIGDHCDPPATLAGDPVTGPMNRFVSFLLPAGPTGEQTAIRVRLTSLHHPAGPPDAQNFTAFEGQYRYLNAIRDGGNNPVFDCPDSATFGTFFKCAKLGCQPEYRDWATALGGGGVSVTGDVVVPSSQYHVSHLGAACAGNEENCAAASAELLVATERWGNVDNVPPQGMPNASDIGRLVDKAKGLPTAYIEPRCQMQGPTPNPYGAAVNAMDIGHVVDAVKGKRYPFTISACP